MRHAGLVGLAMLVTATLTAQVQDIAVRSSVSQTALWVGAPVTYTVALSCPPGLDVLQEDLAADRLPLDGLQVVGHSLDRRATRGRVEYLVTYDLTTFEPGAETVGVREWVVRYGSSSQAGSTAAARELKIPGVTLAWRSALPGAIAALDLRSSSILPVAPAWWGSTRSSAMALFALAALLFASAVTRRVAAGRRLRLKPRVKRTSARELQTALQAIRDRDMADPATRLAAFDDLDARVRQMTAGVTSTPVAALTPGELRTRLAAAAPTVDADGVAQVLEACERARYQPIDRLPTATELSDAVDAAQRALRPAR